MAVLPACDLLRPVLVCFCHRTLLFTFLELDAASQEYKFIEYDHERAALMVFFLTVVLCVCTCVFSKGYDPDSADFFFLDVLREGEALLEEVGMRKKMNRVTLMVWGGMLSPSLLGSGLFLWCIIPTGR